VQAASFSDAQAQSAFSLYNPQGLGTPQIFLPPSHAASGADAVWFVYASTHPYGTVWVGESPPDIPDNAARLASYQDIVAENGQPNVTSTAEIVTVRGSDTALVGTSLDAGATIEWVDSGVQFVVQGPTLIHDQVIAIANSI
jgi:hypothetical protein